MSSLHCAEEDKKANADTHLAEARSQNTETGILGLEKEYGGVTFWWLLFLYRLQTRQNYAFCVK